MKYFCLGAAACAISAAACAQSPYSPEKTLWYTHPAVQWEETVPVGNGRLGMMPYGNPRHEHVVLNEISMWSGCRANYDNPDASTSLPEIRRLLLEGRNREAQELMYSSFVPHKPTDGGTYGSYQMLADLNIEFSYGSDADAGGYRRWLDLSEACAYTSYSIGGVDYVQECYVPRESDVMIFRVAASEPGAVSFTASLSRPERATVCSSGRDRLTMSGELDSGADGTAGVRYSLVAGTFATGSGATTSSTDSTLTVRGADEAYIVMSAATSYLYGERYATEAARAVAETIAAGDFEAQKAMGMALHAELFDRAEVRLPRTPDSELPTDERILRFAGGNDPALAALYYNYGRYLLICSTMPGVLPPNLQGLWANGVQTPWNGDYHTNINVQMNHWPAEPGNLSELHGPLIDLVKRSVANGEHTARVFYGPDARGWVMHMMTNVWGYTDPGEHPSWGATNTGGAWLCAHLWEHWLYTADRQYLSEIYPVLKGAAEFFRSTMIREPKHGWLVTAPTSSPENTFYVGDDPTPISICMGPAMDSQLVRELYGNVAEAAGILGVDAAFADSLRTEMQQLPPHRTGSDGRLMEWLEEYREVDPRHRHVSHLYALHPGNQISAVLTPDLADACRLTLERRGDEGTGWSRAWKVNFWARLGDGNRAYKLFKSLLVPAYTAEQPHHGPGTFPNLFCSHPPFQMDGNWGGAAGIGEMLLQSQDGFINPLPALPDEWSEGETRGFKVRGGATVDMKWHDGRLRSMTLTGGPVEAQRVRVPAGVSEVRVDGRRAAHGEYLDLNLALGVKTTVEFSYR
ncbi:MAG: glycoside hydrolase family 95 protein [Muribaculaceae bacterium]|nr:glycoside hydrolase family 95 protein [Muribaculaceae bacterium]